jgi:NAD+ kinase
MLELRRVGLVTRDDESGRYPFERLQSLFASRGAELVPLGSYTRLENNSADRPPLDLLLAMGGDGTVLRALGTFPEIPVVGINYGSLGFLTAGEQREIERIVERLFTGDYFIEERLALQTQFQRRSQLVVNEMIVKSTLKMVSVDVFIDGHFVHTFRGDGVVVGTPTGSTSYLMATGSSIVMPTVDCFVLNGINEHRFSGRSIIVDGASTVRLRINPASRDPEIFLAHDGRDRIDLKPEDEILVCRDEGGVRLIFFEKDYFFRNLKSRLRW